MWLPEMAVDIDTLMVMQSQGLQYTILCPHQVQLDGRWVDSTRSCFVRLPNGQTMTIFLRDEELSNRLAFDPGLTTDAALFSRWCRDMAQGDRGLFVIATEGETFGHHQSGRQFFLRSLLREEAARAGFEITTPGRYLRHNRPQREVKIVENTAWSCAHGVSRWSIGCACTSGNGMWKPRLRTAFDRLAGAVDVLYENECRHWLDNPWKLRDSYINVILGKTDGMDLLQRFLGEAIPTENAIRILHLLEAGRYCQAMYTSGGWYFEDLSRIEPRSNIAYAVLTIEQVKRATGIDLSEGFRHDLAAVQSWITDETGRDIYDRIAADRRI
jgi:hypothetical protein